MNDATNGYELLLQHPGTPVRDRPPPHARMGRLPDRRLAAQRQAWPEGRSAPGEHLTAAGTDGAGRWTVYHGELLRAHRLRVAAARHRGADHPAGLVAHALAELAPARRADAGTERAADRARLRPREPRGDVPALRGARRRREAHRPARAAHVRPGRRHRDADRSGRRRRRPTGPRRTCSSGSRGSCSTAAAARRADATARKRLPQAPGPRARSLRSTIERRTPMSEEGSPPTGTDTKPRHFTPNVQLSAYGRLVRGTRRRRPPNGDTRTRARASPAT